MNSLALKSRTFTRRKNGALCFFLAALSGCAVAPDGSSTPSAMNGSGSPIEVGSTTSGETAGGWLAAGPAVASMRPHRYDVFVLGGGGGLFRKRLIDGVWDQNYTLLATGLTSKPAVVSWGPNRIDIVARGSDNALWHWWTDDGENFAGPENLGGSLAEGPAITSTGLGKLQIFTVAAADRQLQEKTYPVMIRGRQFWSGWTPLGGYITSAPAATARGSVVDVFARGGDAAMWHKAFDGSAWGSWGSLGGYFTSGPAATASTAGIHLYARNGSGGISANNMSAYFGWGSWQLVPVDGGTAYDPASIPALNETCDHLFFTQLDGSLGHRGCGDTAVVSFTGSGGTYANDTGAFRTSDETQSALTAAGYIQRASLEGQWPRELILLDQAIPETSGVPSVNPQAVSAHYSSLPGWQSTVSDPFGISPDYGPYKESRTTTFPIQQARLVDHGSCSIKEPWTTTTVPGDVAGASVSGGFFFDLYAGINASIQSGAPANSTVTRELFKMEPLFLSAPGATDPGAATDGFSVRFRYNIHTSTAWYLPNTDVEVEGWANYQVGMVDGVLNIQPIGDVYGHVNKDLTATIASLFKKHITSSADMVASMQTDIPNQLRQAYLDKLKTVGVCDSTATKDAARATCVAWDGLLASDLTSKMTARGMTQSGATALANQFVSKVVPQNYECIADTTGGTAGLCKFHPVFKRVNVLPDGFELVVADSDDPSNNDVSILSWEAPSDYTACQNATPSPVVSDRMLTRLDGDIWWIK